MDVYAHYEFDEVLRSLQFMTDSQFILKWCGDLARELKQHTNFNPQWNHLKCMQRVERSRRFRNMTLIERKIEGEKYFISLISKQIKEAKNQRKKNRLLEIQKVSKEYLEDLKSLAGVL